MNFLKETLDKLKECEKEESDVVAVIGSYEDSEYADIPIKFSFDKFKEFANFDYDEGYGCDFIPARLKIVGTDWWMERHEYDGSEWWEFRTMFDLSKFEETNETEKILKALGR